ncbi:MAG TPA: hypothetical protein VHY36_17510 [Steroidobacteraceae bacterium]|jgi:hypothetical protein|nr:hypothetical protein [Steroidobacteraceae bacterium]
MKYVAPSGPLTVGGVLDNWLRLFRASIGTCWALALVAAVAGALVEFTITPTLPPPPGTPALQSYLHYWSQIAGPTTFLADIVLWFVSLVVYGAVLTQQTEIVRGGEGLSFGNALSKGLSRVPQMLLGGVLLVLIITAVIIPFGIVAAVMVPLLRHSPSAMLAAAPVVVVMFIVLIYVTVRLQLWMAVLFSENIGGASSLGRSWDLVKGQWWRVTAVGFVSGIVIWILSFAVGAIGGFAIGLASIHGATPEALLRRAQLVGAAAQVARLLTMPLLTAVWLAIYQDVKLRREGGDLAARAEALSGG